MGCIYCSNFNGQCMLCVFDDEGKCIDDGMVSGHREGICVCDDDPDPSESCDGYESDGNDDY